MKLKQLLAGILPIFLLTSTVFGQIVSGPLVSTNGSVAVFGSSNGKKIISSPVMIDIVGNIWFAGPGSLIANDMTTAERTSLSPTNGMIIYNSTTSQFERYQAGAWGPFGSGSGSTNGTPEYVNGILLSGPINLTNSSTLIWSVTGTNVSATPVNLTSAQLATDSVSADELNALGVESELEAVLDLQDLQGAVTDAQVPDNITITLYVNGSSITGHRFTNSPTAFFDVSNVTNITVNPTNLANAQISATAAIAKTKISSSGTWPDSDLSTNVPIKNAVNVWTGASNNFTTPVIITNLGSIVSGNGAGLTNLGTSNLVNLAAGAVLIGQGAGPVGGAITSNTNYVLHGGSSAAFGPITSTDIAGATNFGGVRFSVEPVNSSLIFDAVVRETSGYVSNGLTALTVTGGSFVAGDVGKTIQVWQPDRIVTDAIITNATAKLVSATAAFTAVDLGKTIEVSGAGATGLSLVSTISSVDSAIQVTLAGNAGTTVSNVAARIISVPLVTSIAAVGGATTATLTAGPSVTHTNAHVVYGTDNRVALSNDCATAQTTGRNLLLSGVAAIVSLNSANPWAVGLRTNTLNVIGRNTKLIVIWDSIPSYDGGLFQVYTNASLRLSSLTINGYGPNSTYWVGTPHAAYLTGGGDTQFLELSHVDVTGMGDAAGIGTGLANARYFNADHCRWITAVVPTYFFAANGGTYQRRMRDMYLESTRTITTTTNDTQYNNHVVYDHPSVAQDWLDVETKLNSTASASYHLHQSGSGVTNVASFLRFARTRFNGNGNACTLNSPTLAQFDSCIFLQTGTIGISSLGDVTIRGGMSSNSCPLLIQSGSGQHFNISQHSFYGASAPFTLSVGAADLKLSDCYIAGTRTSEISSPSNVVSIVNNTFAASGAGSSVSALFAAASNCAIKVIGCTFTGTFPFGRCMDYGSSTNTDFEVSYCLNKTSASLVRDFSATGANAGLHGNGNCYNVSGGEPQSDGRVGGHFAARQMLNPTAIASASSISPTANFDTHQITGSTTINTILIGGSTARNLVAYEITLVPATGATWSLGSSGNIVALSSAARTAGQAYTFRWDSIDQKWRETGLPGSSAVTEVFTNAPNVFSANASNTYNGAVRFVGRVQFPAVPLTGTTIDGSTNSLLLTLTTNAVLDWAGIDSDDVVLEALQDSVGGHTMTINNVGLWNNTNQSTVMPLIDTNANNRSWIHLWRHGSTSEGSVYTTPSQWEMDWARMAATSAQVRAAVTDPTGTGALVFGTSPTLTTPTIASFANANHNHQNSAGGGTLAEAALALTDVTTANATTSAHGFMPKLNGNTNTFYNGNGGFTTPPGSGGTPGGTNGDVQFNSNGVFVAEAAFNYNSTNKTLTVPRIATTNIVVSGPTNGTWTLWDGDGGESVIFGAPPSISTNGIYYWPIQPDTGLYFGTNNNGIVQQGILQHPAANGKMLYTTNTPFGGYFWADPPAGTVIPTGTMINTGASVVSQVPRYTDATGTNVAPSTMTVNATGGVTITNAATTNVTLLVQGFSGGTNKIFDVGTNGVSSLAVDSAGRVLIGDGSQGRPAMSFGSDPTTGWYKSGANSWTFSSAATAAWTLSGTQIQGFTGNPILNFNGTSLTIDGAGIWQMGADSGAPVAQTLKGPDGSGSNIGGGNVTIGPGRPTSTGAPGRVLIAVATNSTSSGSTAQNFGTPVTSGGTLKVNTTTTGNVGGGEDDLITYSLGGQMLSVNGDYLEWDAWGSFAANANTKDLKIYFGAAVLIDTTALVLNGVDWRAHGKIVRTGAATQTATTELTIGGTLLSALNSTIADTTAPTETLSSAITFKCTGTDSGGVPADNNIVQNGMVIKWFAGQ